MMRNTDSAAATTTGNPCVFVDLYERTLTDVYSYLASRVGDRATAEDLTQEVFVAGARRVAAGAYVDLPWLIAVARHKLVDHWRSRAREERKVALVRMSERTRCAEDPVSMDPGAVADVLRNLNPIYRAALVLRHVDGLSVAAVADHLHRSVEATEQVLTRARIAFRGQHHDRNQGPVDE